MVEQRAKFTQMKNGDAEDYSIIAASNANDYGHLADKVLNHLLELKDDYGGFQVDRLTHSLQTATRAYRDGQIMNMLFVHLYMILVIIWHLQIMLNLQRLFLNLLYLKKTSGL